MVATTTTPDATVQSLGRHIANKQYSEYYQANEKRV